MSYKLDFENDLQHETRRKKALRINQNLEDRSCIHPEVTEFRTHYVRDYYGQTNQELLQKCYRCGVYLALDGTEVPTSRLIDLREVMKVDL